MRWAVLFLLTVATLPVFVVFALYVRWWWRGGRGAEGERLPLTWQVAGFAQEVVALMLVAVRALRQAPDPVGEDRSAPPDVVLFANGALENAALRPLCDRMIASGRSVMRFRHAFADVPIADAAAQIEALLGAYPHRRGLVLIAFGTAGLTLRYYLRRYAATGIRRVVTIATPHQGTAAPLRGSAPELAADTLRQVAAGDRVPQQFDVIAISSDFDAFIAPATNAYYPGAFNIQVRGVGHFTLAHSARLFELVSENLDATAHAAPSMTASTRSKS